jgi:hypothetical protein
MAALFSKDRDKLAQVFRRMFNPEVLCCSN